MDVEQGRRQPLAPGQGAQPDGHGAWSPRARRLIEETHALCDSWLEAPLRACLLDAEHKLFGQAEQARNYLDQQVHMSVRLRLQNHREMLEQRFFTEVARRFERLGAKAADSAPLELSLLDDNEDDERAALEQAGVRSEARHAPALFELSYRYGALASLPPMEGEDLPLGAQALSRAFLDALRDWELPIRHRLLLLDAFDHMVVRHLASLYETVNQHLAGEGILPHLHAYRVARPGDGRGLRIPAPVLPGSLPGSAPGVPAPELGEHVLDMLRELLALQRAAAPPPAAVGQALSDEQLQQLLAALQQPLAHAAQQVAADGQATRLRDQLLALLNAGTEGAAPKLSLSARQDDTVQLVALLFDQMTAAMQRDSHAYRLLGEWEVPLLRMALADRDVFDQREHPARRLLAAMSEAAHDWLDGGDHEVDRSLATKLAQLAERAQREPPSAALYASLLTDIEHHLSLLSRKAQATERRQVEAMQGRERLEHARRHAAELMAERFRSAPPRGLVRTLLERAWSDVLALTLLRNGEESDTFAARLRITDQLLGLAAIEDRNSLLEDIQTGLQQIGMQAEEAAQVARRLLGGSDDASDDGLSATGVALKLKQHQRLGELQATEAAVPAEPAKAAAPLDDAGQLMHAHLLTLPFGTWFDFLDEQGNVLRTQKLAWYSTVSGRCLFVTRRGSRGDELALEQLARHIVQGRVREAVAPRENLFDRAVRALMENLRPGAAHGGRS